MLECYVDDLTVKSRWRIGHLGHLKAVFNKTSSALTKDEFPEMRVRVQFMLIPGGLWFSIGIKVDPVKIKVNIELPLPISIRELKGFQDRTAYIRRFISNLSERCKPFS